MTPMLTPLSAEWFHALQRRMNAQPEKYRRIGASDVRMIVQVTRGVGWPNGHRVGLVFEDYGCAAVCDAPNPDAFDPDFTIEGAYEAWTEMVASICENGRADARHTLNTLTLMDDPLRVTGADQSRVDQFARHNYTLQEFFNDAANIEDVGRARAGERTAQENS